MKCKIRNCLSSTLNKYTFHTIPSAKKHPQRHTAWKRFIDEVRIHAIWPYKQHGECFRTSDPYLFQKI